MRDKKMRPLHIANIMRRALKNVMGDIEGDASEEEDGFSCAAVNMVSHEL